MSEDKLHLQVNNMIQSLTITTHLQNMTYYELYYIWQIADYTCIMHTDQEKLKVWP